MTPKQHRSQAHEERGFSDPSEVSWMHVMTFSDSSLPPVLPEDAAPLVATVAGSVLLPGDAGYDDERAVWNLNHELVPAVIVVPESAADVQAAVTFAAGEQQHGLGGTQRRAICAE